MTTVDRKGAGSPLVSVVVPSLNRREFLRPTIDSILGQDYSEVECIVVDGGSTDGTLDILQSYGTAIRWVSGPDEGHADAINKGWHMSRGELLAWLNADDIYVTSTAVSQAVAHFKRYPEVDVVYGDYLEIDRDGAPIGPRLQPLPYDLVYAVAYCDHVISQPSSFMRRSILEKVGWLDPTYRYAKDHELWLRVGLAGVIAYTPILFAGVRIIPGLSQHLENSWSKVRLTEKFFSLPNLPHPFNLPPFRRRALSNASLVAGFYAWSNGFRSEAIRLLAQSVPRDPRNLPYIGYRLLQYFSPLVLPVRARQAVKRILARLGVVDRLHRLPGVGRTALQRRWFW